MVEKLNSLTEIRGILDGMKGHNYALPDCIKFIMEHIGVHDLLDFWNIAAVTGDTVAQIYNHNVTTSCEYCVSGYLAGPDYITYIFNTLGYDCEYASAAQIAADISLYSTKIEDYIDKNIPILVKTNLNDIDAWKSDVGTYCLVVGYEDGGKTLKLLTGGTDIIDYKLSIENKLDFIFIGKRQRNVSLEEIYICVLKKMPHWLTLPKHSGMCFGSEAYKTWADDIESGRFEDENLPLWENYGVYVCNLATNGGEPTYIYKKLANLNHVYSEIAIIGERIQKLLPAESPTGGRSLLWVKLEELNAGMDMEAVRITMRDKKKRSEVADVLRDYAKRLDQALEIMREGNNIINKINYNITN